MTSRLLGLLLFYGCVCLHAMPDAVAKAASKVENGMTSHSVQYFHRKKHSINGLVDFYEDLKEVPPPESEDPSFAEPIPNVTIAAGRDVTLPCVVDHLGSYRVAWIHTDRHTLLTLHDRVITRNPRYSISHNGYRTWWLHIRDVRQQDSGHYMCQINTSPMKSQVGFLDIVVPPKIDEENTSSDSDVREGAEVTLRCRASGSPAPHIKWRREDDKDITIGMKRVPSIQGDYLNITKVSRLHMGAYLCIAANGVPPSVSKRIMLNVNFAPMIWIPNQLIGAAVGTDITLDCNLESHPRSVTYWTREGGLMILSNNKYDILMIDTGIYKVQMRLRIRNLRPDDFGSYTCVAKNSLGETEGTIRLYEIPRPTLAIQTAGSILSGIRGQEKKTDISDGLQSEDTSVNLIIPASGQNIEQDTINRDGDSSPNQSKHSQPLSISVLLLVSLSFILLSSRDDP